MLKPYDLHCCQDHASSEYKVIVDVLSSYLKTVPTKHDDIFASILANVVISCVNIDVSAVKVLIDLA
ncbi:hypothetical protein ACTXT7_007090 [Hymenolepis weldensis]